MGERGQFSEADQLDLEVRRYIYDEILTREQMPSAAAIAQGLGRGIHEVRESFRRLKEGHILVLQEGDEEVLMANPFSAVPTPFVVQIGDKSWWGNCIWDVLDVAAMVKGDALIATACGDCNDAMLVRIESGQARFEHGDGIIHFSVPASRWWDNIKFT